MRIAFLVLLTAIAACVFAFEPGDSVVVQVREADLRSTPGFLGAVVRVVQYETAATVVEVRGDWVLLQLGESDQTGWMHSSALLAPQTRGGLLAGNRSGQRGASSSEIALAGRGFNAEVEAEYQSETGLDFSTVDEMETYTLPIDLLGEFFATAGLEFGEDTE
jgi:hypothetical protein